MGNWSIAKNSASKELNRKQWKFTHAPCGTFERKAPFLLRLITVCNLHLADWSVCPCVCVSGLPLHFVLVTF
jgi:hypothetical protein